MRIAIDATTICDAAGGVGAGIEHYTWSVIFALLRRFPAHTFSLFVPRVFSATRKAELAQGCRSVRFYPVDIFSLPFFTRHVLFPFVLACTRPHVLFVPTPHLPILWRGPSVITVHDMAIFDHAEWFPKKDAASISTRRLVPSSIRRASRIIAISASTAQAVRRLFPETGERVGIIHSGVRIPPSIEPLERFRVTTECVLCLGTIEPRKNLVNAIYAFHRFLSDHPDRARGLRLILAGKWGWKTETVKAAMGAVNMAWKTLVPDGVVQATGPVFEQEKWALLRHASVLLFPSLDEGFGLPALEAMAMGTPVICSNRGGLPEVVGDVGFLCSPDDVETMALLLAQVLLMPDALNALREEGWRRASTFTWEKTAEGVMRVIEDALNKDQSA